MNTNAITISLAEIRAKSPCADGWRKVLEAKGPDMEAQFPLADIIETNDFDDALWAMRCRPEYSNLWRKYAVWCARQVEHLMTDDRSVAALDVAWHHSDGLTTDEELATASAAAWDAAIDAPSGAARAAARATARATASVAAWAAAIDAPSGAASAAPWAAARATAWGAAWSAPSDASSGAAIDAARATASAAAWDAASAAQKQKLIEILTAGGWV